MPTAYVRDGLVAWYDGVENTRDGQDTESVVWHDKAGGYGIQGLAGLFIREITGSYSGIMGLPVFETGALLRPLGLTAF